MRDSERTEALKSFGYTEREAAFLTLTALHGGYFLRRQYGEYIGKEVGGTAAALVEKLLSRKHAVAMTALNNTRIYHLSSRPFYAEIGETDNRNRREHSPVFVKKRLMALDFVLANPGHRYLATEREKVDYFSGRLGIPLSDLPLKLYVSLKTPSTTTRYFVDKYPIFLHETNSAESKSPTCFCYLDGGSETTSGFKTHLEQYSRLWRALQEFRVIYVSDTSRLFSVSEKRFASFMERLAGQSSNDKARSAKQMIEYFEARSLYEKGDFSSFSRDKLVRLRNESAQFSEPKYQALYERWKAVGAQVVFDSIAPGYRITWTCRGTFSTYLVEHRYDCFGTNRRLR
jgi:hypothetical protein